MKCKKLSAVLLAVCLMLLAACPVFAEPVPTFAIDTVPARAGDTVTVTLSLTQVSGISGIAAHVTYDGAVLECLGAKTCGFVNNMDMADANPNPIHATNEVWLSGLSLSGVAGSGAIMEMTFKVKENAPAGLSVIGFSSTWAPELLGNDADAEVLEYTMKQGGVQIGSDAPAVTTQATAAATTAAPDVSTAAGEVTTAPTKAPAVPTLPNGSTVAVTEETAVDIDGNVVTQPNGEAAVFQTVALMLDEVTAAPGEQVTLKLSLSQVSDLTAMIVDVTFDEQAFEYVSYTVEELGKEMNMVQVQDAENGMITVSGTDPEGVSGGGAVIALTLKVKNDTKAGEYRFAVADTSSLLMDKVALPYKGYTGIVTVSGDSVGGGISVRGMVIGAVVVVAAIGVILLVVFRRKKSPQTPHTAAPTPPQENVNDISGEE